MYASSRSAESSFITAIGVEADGSRTPLSALTISESRDRLVAQSFLNDAARRGEEEQVCAAIAGRVGESIVMVEIAREEHDTIARFRGGESLRNREILASCEAVS